MTIGFYAYALLVVLNLGNWERVRKHFHVYMCKACKRLGIFLRLIRDLVGDAYPYSITHKKILRFIT